MRGYVQALAPCLCALGLAVLAGCGSKQKAVKVTPERMVSLKVQAMKQMADAVAKDPNGPAFQAAFEEFRNTPFSAQANPAEAAEIVDVYNKQVRGKLRGELAQEVQIEVGSIQAALKRSK